MQVSEEIPASMKCMVAKKRAELIAKLCEECEEDDELLQKFVNDEAVSAVDLEQAIRRAKQFVPVFMATELKNKGNLVYLAGSPDGPLVAMAYQLLELNYIRVYEGLAIENQGDDFIITNIKTGWTTTVVSPWIVFGVECVTEEEPVNVVDKVTYRESITQMGDFNFRDPHDSSSVTG